MSEDLHELPPLTPPPEPAPLPRSLGARLRAYFFTGLLVAGPLAITAYIVWYLIALADGWVRPLIPEAYNPETYLRFTIPGFGLIAAFLGITLLGFLTANLVGRALITFGERVLQGMPFVRSVYSAIKQIFETVFKQGGTSFRRVGLIEWPGPGFWTLCLIAETTAGRLAASLPDGKYLNVFIPCSPNPTTGYFVVMREDRIRDVDMSPDEVFKIIMSMGIIQPQQRPAQNRLPR
ncbi:membrane protein [Terrihabitans soli]|uniref:Membrane protein n=1 Tax=Terrihabitans soli TaxID=708113 RepID=A0A6S6QTM7_9HYPH|nr:DUF502 domain-containing protein [Terrihabitans soli]BCJ90945.1 membrane protein [Terrihabitans soli]